MWEKHGRGIVDRFLGIVIGMIMGWTYWGGGNTSYKTIYVWEEVERHRRNMDGLPSAFDEISKRMRAKDYVPTADEMTLAEIEDVQTELLVAKTAKRVSELLQPKKE